MVESAALLMDEVLPQQPIFQWVLSVPFPLRFRFTRRPSFEHTWTVNPAANSILKEYAFLKDATIGILRFF
jgi:hypothetical protein